MRMYVRMDECMCSVSTITEITNKIIFIMRGLGGTRKTVPVPPLMYLLHIAGNLLCLLRLALGLPGVRGGITQRCLRLSGLVVGGGNCGVDGWDLFHGVFSGSFVVVDSLVKVCWETSREVRESEMAVEVTLGPIGWKKLYLAGPPEYSLLP